MPGDVDTARASIGALLQPSSIAIAGASGDPGKLGSLPLSFLVRHGYAGRIHPIHPTLEQIHGIPCRRSIADIDDDIDLLVVAVAASRIPALLDECRPGQVKAALILSSGFAETGAEGRRAQDALAEKALEKGIRFIGPNSVGVANLHHRIVPSISQVFDQSDLAPGPIGFVTQSGAVGTAITALAHAERIGIGYFLSTGNEGDLEFSDFCDYFAADPAVRIIAGYVESIRDGEKFRTAAAKALGARKPVVLIKVGASEVGGKAVRSHTGALAGSEEVYRTAFDQLGVIRTRSIEDLIDVLKVMSAFPRARPCGGAKGKVAILSHSGGAGVLMADACVGEGLDVAPPSATLVEALKRRLPAYASFQNPIDMTANVIFDPKLMADTVRDVVRSGEYDAVMLCVNLIWRQGDALAQQLAGLADTADTLVAVSWIAGMPQPRDLLNAGGVPVFPDPVRCVKAVAARLRWESRWQTIAADAAADAPAPAATPADDLDGFAVQERLLRSYGIEMAPAGLAASLDQARRVAARLGYPVAAKLVARNLAHKSDIGAVCLGIDSDEGLERAFARLDAIAVAHKEGILIQRMIDGGLEVFVGMKRDEVFGPVAVVGLGGIYVEIIRETAMRLAPFDVAQARRLIRESKFAALLDGARGRPKLDVDALARIVSQVSVLAMAEPSVLSLDLNPVIVGETGARVVDFKFERGARAAQNKSSRRLNKY